MIDYKNDEIIKDIYECAMTVFGHGIAVPSKEHPCGWDWLDFDMVDDRGILNYTFTNSDISDGCHGVNDYEDLTLKKILEVTEGKFLFEINTNVDWSEEGR